MAVRNNSSKLTMKNKIAFNPPVIGSLPLNERSLIRWGFKMTEDGSFDRELNGVRITLEYQVRFNGKILCDAPETEQEFEKLYNKLTGMKLSGNDH